MTKAVRRRRSHLSGEGWLDYIYFYVAGEMGLFMEGFDNKALAFILSSMKEEDANMDTKVATEVMTLIMAYDLEYMRQEGIIAETEFTDEYYDDDDAFDFIIEKLANAMPHIEPFRLTEMLEAYFEYHDAYMEDIGMLNWQ